MKAKDSIENVLDRLSDMREELLSIERSVERIEADRDKAPRTWKKGRKN